MRPAAASVAFDLLSGLRSYWPAVLAPALLFGAAAPRRQALIATTSQPGVVGYRDPLGAVSPDGAWLASSGWHSPFLRLSNVRTGELAHEWKSGLLVGISFTPDSGALVALRPDECAFWDVKTRQMIRRIPRDASPYNTGVAFSPDEKLMALEVSPGVIHLIEFATSRTVAKLTDPSGDRATWLSFTPDGTQIVTTSNYAKTVHVWDLRRIRAGLKEMLLDWDWPDFTASGPTVGR